MNQIDLACESFRNLLEEQLLRVSSMKSEKTDFSQKEVITMGIIDGDGIGREDKVGRCRLGGFPATAHANACDSRSNRQHDDNRNPNSLFTANVHILSD